MKPGAGGYLVRKVKRAALKAKFWKVIPRTDLKPASCGAEGWHKKTAAENRDGLNSKFLENQET